jgi:hypothetical protein
MSSSSIESPDVVVATRRPLRPAADVDRLLASAVGCWHERWGADREPPAVVVTDASSSSYADDVTTDTTTYAIDMTCADLAVRYRYEVRTGDAWQAIDEELGIDGLGTAAVTWTETDAVLTAPPPPYSADTAPVWDLACLVVELVAADEWDALAEVGDYVPRWRPRPKRKRGDSDDDDAADDGYSGASPRAAARHRGMAS